MLYKLVVAVVKALERFYGSFVNKDNVDTMYSVPSEHAIVRDNY